MRVRRLFTAVSIPALVAGMLLSSPASAQEQSQPQGDLQSVAVQPVGTNPNDPNNGQWFVADVEELGKPIPMKAAIVNVERVPQTVKLYLADLEFTADGTPQVAEKSTDIGTWGKFETPEVTVGPQSKVEVAFSVIPPPGADPGDHIGVVVAENKDATGGGTNRLAVVKRVATRLYVTVPGVAKAEVAVDQVSLSKDSSFLTREITTKVVVRNTGRVKLAPTIFINGKKAEGSAEILSHSVQTYYVSEPVPLWGGPRRSAVDVRTIVNGKSGPAARATASVFVIPWILMVGLVVLLGFTLLVRRMWRRRGGKYAEMRADMRRIERLLAEQRSGAAIETRDDDPEVAIKAAIKRAGRAGDKESEGKLKEKLAEHRASIAPPAPEPEPAPVVTTEPVVETRPAPERESVVAASPPPAQQPEPVAETITYDWLLEDSPTEAVFGAEDPKGFYDSLRDVDEPAEPPRTPVQTAMGPGYFVPDPAPPIVPGPPMPDVAEEAAPEPVVATTPRPVPAPAAPAPAEPVPTGEHVDALAAILRELKTAPKKRQEVLLAQARSYGVLTLRAHGGLIDDLPADVKVKLLPKQWAI